MQLRFFKIPVAVDEAAGDELNRFLRAHRLTQVQRELVSEPGGAYWAICIEYLESASGAAREKKKARVDYREVLSEEAFEIFARLRAWRKQRAEADGGPLYALFTNEQLAEIARQLPGTPHALAALEGVGEARAEKYGADVLRVLPGPRDGEGDETRGSSD